MTGIIWTKDSINDLITVYGKSHARVLIKGSSFNEEEAIKLINESKAQKKRPWGKTSKRC